MQSGCSLFFTHSRNVIRLRSFEISRNDTYKSPEERDAISPRRWTLRLNFKRIDQEKKSRRFFERFSLRLQP